MNITDVNKRVPKSKSAKRVGRGHGSGSGKTAGRGQNGLGSRAGGNFLKGFIGGQSTLRQRLPKRGFNNAVFRTEYIPLSIALLEMRFDDGSTIDLDALRKCGIKIRRNDKVKILGQGELSKKLSITVHAYSKSAREKIEKAGGTAEVIA